MAQVLTHAEQPEAGKMTAPLAGELSRAATAASAVLGSTAATETQAAQHRREIIRALSKGKSLVSLIADPHQLDLRQACRVAKIALEEDSDFDKKLVELVKSGVTKDPDQIVRILMVLESVCSAPRLLGHVLDLKHMEGRVRSKLTLMVGRLTRDPQWLSQQLKDQNPRVRANAIEGLWDVRAEGLEELLNSAMHDPHHRVAANAALALHKIGNASAVSSMYEMLRNPDQMFRRAGLWAMGQARDPRFLEAVTALAQTSEGEELNLAIRVREELNNSRESSEFTSSLSLEVGRKKILANGDRCVRMSCIADSASGWLGPQHLTALNFVISEGEVQIEDYRLHWLNGEGPFAGFIAIPRSWNGNGELLKPALSWTREDEKYGFLPYQTPYSEVRGKERDDASEVLFHNYLEISKDYLQRTYEVAKDLNSAIRVGLEALKTQPGKRHLFVLADPSVGDAGALADDFDGDFAGTQIHGVVWQHARAELAESLEALARRSGGQFVMATSARDFIRTIVSVRAAQFGSFELTWRPRSPEAKDAVRITCHSPYGSGEVLLRSR